eukprot:18216-Pyramimonas_sp.AAC.1
MILTTRATRNLRMTRARVRMKRMRHLEIMVRIMRTMVYLKRGQLGGSDEMRDVAIDDLPHF